MIPFIDVDFFYLIYKSYNVNNFYFSELSSASSSSSSSPSLSLLLSDLLDTIILRILVFGFDDWLRNLKNQLMTCNVTEIPNSIKNKSINQQNDTASSLLARVFAFSISLAECFNKIEGKSPMTVAYID
jgi:hypothetical protein